MNALGIIPARWDSSRFPGKILKNILGKPMIQHVIERVEKSNYLKQIVVGTDNKKVIEFVKSLNKSNVNSIMTNPNHLSGTDRVAEVAKNFKYDLVVNIQGDEPLINPKLIDEIILKLNDKSWDMVSAAVHSNNVKDFNNTSVVKVIFDKNNKAMYFSRSPIPCDRDNNDQSIGINYWKHIGIYGYKNNFLQKLVLTQPPYAEKVEKLEQLRALHIGGKICILETNQSSIGVDKPEDIKKVEQQIMEMG